MTECCQFCQQPIGPLEDRSCPVPGHGKSGHHERCCPEKRRFEADQGAAAVESAEKTALFSLAATVTVPVIFRSTRAGLGEYDLMAERMINEAVRSGASGFCPHAGQVGGQLYWYLVPGCPVACPRCVAGWLIEHVPVGSDEETECDVCHGKPNAPGTFQERQLVCEAGPYGKIPPHATTIVLFVCLDCASRERRPAR